MKHETRLQVNGLQDPSARVDGEPYVRLRVVCDCGWSQNCASWKTAVRIALEPHEAPANFPTTREAMVGMYRYMERVVYGLRA